MPFNGRVNRASECNIEWLTERTAEEKFESE